MSEGPAARRLDYTQLSDALDRDSLGRPEEAEGDAPDMRDGRVYRCSPDLKLAIWVALATSRPLLLRGDPGTGKSSLAPWIARSLGYRYYEHATTAATRSQDLLWRFDTVRRLSDAQVRGETTRTFVDADYIEPGVLWWAFAPESARGRGAPADGPAAATQARDPNATLNAARPNGAVVLIDEIDKSDPDVPNGLLGPLASTSFVVTETGVEITRPPRPDGELRDDPLSGLLVVITTNEERDLPPAFVRRCIVHTLGHPDRGDLVAIARLHIGDGLDEDLADALAEKVVELRNEAAARHERRPSTAEFLDALRACLALKIRPGASPAWDVLERACLSKPSGSDTTEGGRGRAAAPV
jgi:MoxR-like ATPase